MQEHEPPQADNLVPEDDNVFHPQIQVPNLQFPGPQLRLNMIEDQTLLRDPFSGSSKEDETEFWRRLETYLEYKESDNNDKLRLAKAMLILTARGWLKNLQEECRGSFSHHQLAFAEKFI